MKLKDSFKIAYQNIKLYKSMTVKIIFGMFGISMVIFCFIILFFSFQNYKASASKKYASECYLYISDTNKNKDSIQKNEQIAIDYNEFLEQSVSYRQISRKIGANEYSEYTATDFGITDNLDYNKIYSGATLLIDNKKYTPIAISKNPSGLKIYENPKTVDITIYQKGNSFIPKNSVNSNNITNFLEGRYPEKAGEVMMSDYILESYGINMEQHKNLIGKKICLFTENKSKKYYFKEYILSGIFKAQILEKREYKLNGNIHTEHIVINFREDDAKKISLKYLDHRFYFASYTELENGEKKLEKILPGKSAMSYNGNKYRIITKSLNVISKILFFIAVGLVISMSVSVVNMLHFFLQRNIKYFSMIRKIGMQSYNVYQIYFIELLILISIALMAGTYCSTIFLMLINIVYRNIVEYNLSLSFGTCLYVIIFLYTYFITLLGIYTGIQCKKILFS